MADAQQIIKDDTTSLTGTGIYDLLRKMEFYQSESSFRISPESFLPFDDWLKTNHSLFVQSENESTSKELNDKIGLENKLPSVLIRPLTLKYQREEKLSLIWGILTKLKDLFALYLGYKHIQKYRLFH